MCTPESLYAELSIGRMSPYDLRNKREYDVPLSKADHSLSTYFINTLHEWNVLDESVRNSATLAEFKCKLLASI